MSTRAGGNRTANSPFPSSKDPNEAAFRRQVKADLEKLGTSISELATNDPPLLELRVSQYTSGTDEYGEVTALVNDIGNNFAGFVRFAVAQGGGDYDHSDPSDTGVYSTTDASSPYTLSAIGPLTPEHDTVVSVAAPYLTIGGDTEWVVKAWSFDHDRTGKLLGPVAIGFTDNGAVVSNWAVDEDSEDIYFTVDLDATPADPTTSTNDGTVDTTSSRSGASVFDGTGGFASKLASVGQLAVVKAMIVSSNGTEVQFGPFSRRRMDTEFVVPRVQTTATRSGTDVDVMHEIDDPSGAFFSMEFRTDGVNWLTSWDTVTPEELYAETVTVGAGLDVKYEWRLRYYDEDGTLQYKGGAINLSDLQEVTKTVRVGSQQMVPTFQSTGPIAFGSLYANAATVPGGGGYGVRGYVALPQGAEITNVSCRMFRSSSSTCSASATLVTGDASSTTLGSWNNTDFSGGSTTTASDPVSQTIGSGEFVTFYALLDPASSVTDVRLYWFEVEYAAPSYDTTI